MNIQERVKTALAILSVPVVADLWIGTSVLPDVYATYTVIDAPALLHGDNAEIVRGYRVQVSVWSRSDPAALNVIGAMTAAGFQRAGMRSLQPDQKSRHFGLAHDFSFTEDLYA